MRQDSDFYKILEVDPDASGEIIKKAYKTLAAMHHPDTGAQDMGRMQVINQAYEVLSNPEKRRLYDQTFKKNSTNEMVDTISIVISVLFVIGLAKILFKAFPPIAMILVPVGLTLIFMRYPKSFAKLYVSIFRPAGK